MLNDAEEKGLVKPGATIVSPPAATLVSRLPPSPPHADTHDLTMPETMSIERRKLAQACSAMIVLTPRRRRHEGSHSESTSDKPKKLRDVIPSQFTNPPTPPFTSAPPALKSGATPRERWTPWWPA
ncbi:MAG: hypothetical protein ACLTQI_04410 [Slackia sp.]